jgi:hypothetical protein
MQPIVCHQCYMSICMDMETIYRIKKSYYDDFHGFAKKKYDEAIQCPEGLILIPAALT